MDEADLLFELDGDVDVMKYITLGIPRTMDEIIEKSMPIIGSILIISGYFG